MPPAFFEAERGKSSSVDEHVGCSASDEIGDGTVRLSSILDAAKSTASITVSSVRAALATIVTRPWVQEDSLTTTGSRPPSVASVTAASTLSVITSSPDRWPLDFQGVPQHSPSRPAGVRSEMPQRAASDAKAAFAPRPPLGSAPNMVPRQDAKKTASAASLCSTGRALPPRGSPAS